MPHVEVPQAEFKVVMLGDTFTGKTSLVLRFAEGYYRESGRESTVGAFFITKRLSVQGITCKVQIWDTAGQEQFKKLAPMYYKNAAAAIICYDITSPQSFETLKYWINELQQNKPSGSIVLGCCATKCDLAADADIAAAQELASQCGAVFMTTSAKNNTNVTALFEKVADRVLSCQRESRESRDGSKIPVTMATTSLNTPAMSDTRQGPSQSESGDLGTRALSSGQSPTSGKRNPTGEEDEDDVIDPAESKESSVAEEKGRCDANMLMCGEVLEGGHGMGCLIM